jgi:hypothetical protein
MADCDSILPWIGKGWKGVEIGVAGGHSALRFLEYGVAFLWLVDPWKAYPEYLESNPTEGYYDRVYKEAMDRLSPHAGKHAHLRMTSAEAREYIPGPVDFVWVDGNHRYEFVKADLEAYWPLIREGGVLCGHDYTDNDTTCQVARAVNEFAAANDLPLELAPPSWVIRK